jgi:hypothetical protein
VLLTEQEQLFHFRTASIRFCKLKFTSTLDSSRVASLREYHSGWVMDNYVCDAKKRYYQLKFGKIFKHESVHSILKKSLPTSECMRLSFQIVTQGLVELCFS